MARKGARFTHDISNSHSVAGEVAVESSKESLLLSAQYRVANLGTSSMQCDLDYPRMFDSKSFLKSMTVGFMEKSERLGFAAVLGEFGAR